MAATAAKILRRAVHAFLQDYNVYATIAALFVFPASASLLISEALLSPPSSNSSTRLLSIQSRVHALFAAAGFPASTRFFTLLALKLSQTFLTFAATLPFTLTFLILAKAAVIRILCRPPSTQQRQLRQHPLCISAITTLYRPLLRTHLCNYLLVLCTNAAAFAVMFVIFNLADLLRLSSSPNVKLALSVASGVFYSVVLAHVLVVCSLAVIISGAEGRGGGVQVVKAFLLMKGRAPTAMSLAIPITMGLAAVEALFQYKVVRAYHASGGAQMVVGEAFSIIYIHSMFVVIDVIASCVFFNSCKLSSLPTWEAQEDTNGSNQQEEILQGRLEINHSNFNAVAAVAFRSNKVQEMP